MSALTSEQTAIRDMTREFVRKEVAPFAAEWDRSATVPLPTLRKAGALGFFGVGVPPEWGGSGADFVSYILMTEELAYGDAGVCNMISATNAFAWKVRDHGTPAQKARFLRPVAAGEALACLMYTEPQAGSDAANQQTRAVRHGDRWVINGTKSFITNAGTPMSGFVIITALTGQREGMREVSTILVPNGTPGYVIGRPYRKIGWHASDTRELVFSDCRVDRACLLGPRGDGVRHFLSILDGGRIGVAALGVGLAQGCLDISLAYAHERKTFGQPIARYQAIQFMLAELATQVQAARLLTYEAALLKDNDESYSKAAAMAKLFASELAVKAADVAVQVHGGLGYMDDTPAARFYRDAKILTLGEGTSEIMKIVIARRLGLGS